MFDFINKTITDLRNEVANYIGKAIIVTGGQKKIVESVSECTNLVIPKDNDWGNWFADEKGLHYKGNGKEVYGFFVTFYQISNEKYKYTQAERIAVPLDLKDEKIKESNQVHKNIQISILN